MTRFAQSRDLRAEVEAEFAEFDEQREYLRACTLMDHAAFTRAKSLERPHGAGRAYVIEPLAMAPLVSCAHCMLELPCRLVFADDARHQLMGHSNVCPKRRASLTRRGP